ncbi:MAG: ABC transporter ATP-binding protein [Pseudonocardiales bacterium]|nr:MAG: ABC transporter ATP-binding protein [Pseudonocardiales bacterium]
MALVEVRGLYVSFGAVHAVVDIDLTVTAGASVALVGRNGAGKSTTLRVLAGVQPPSAGAIRVAGIDAAREPAAVRARVGYCPDVGGLIPRATPWEHLALAARLRDLPDGWQGRGRDLLERFDLGTVADRLTASFSHGMGRRLSVVLAAFHTPDVLLLDEPFDGVDPLGVEATMLVIAEARLAGAAVLVSTHLLPLAVEACDEAVVLRGGSVVAAAPATELAGELGATRYRSLLA